MTPKTSATGIVLNYQSNFYTVKVGKSTYQCFLKGLIKKEGSDVVVGDRVVIDNLDEANQAARIIQVLERKNQLSRPKIANITKAMIVASIDNPSLEFQQLDRYLTHVLLAHIEPMICISKVDLATDPEAIQEVRNIYEPLGISVYSTTIQEEASIKRLFDDLNGETVVFAGLSGVGKSSLLNAIKPGLGLAVQEVSEKIQRGQHTTRQVSLISINGQTYVADTPGFSYLKFDKVSPQSLKESFKDFAPFQADCRFDDCLHLDEENCAVRENLDKIAPSRYASYEAFQEEAKVFTETQQSTSQKQEYGYKTLNKGKKPDLQILKLTGKQRETSRRTQKQRIPDWTTEGDTLEE